MNRYKLILLMIISFLFLFACTQKEAKETKLYYETKEEAFKAFFEGERYSHKNIIATETKDGTEIVVFVERGIGFAVVENTIDGYRINWDGYLRDYESKDVEGMEGFIEIQASDEKKFPLVIGKVFDGNIKRVEIRHTANETSDYITLEEGQKFWYHFYEGDYSMIEIHYHK